MKPDRFGVIVRARTLPQVGVEEYQKSARFLADAWRCTRVSVLPDGPGRVVIRGVRSDPLTTPTAHRPTGLPPVDLTRWELGIDEYAAKVCVSLANVPGVTVAGVPGAGKTSGVNKFVCDFAPSASVQIAGADGKVSRASEGDYADLVKRMFAFCGDNLDEANARSRPDDHSRRRPLGLPRLGLQPRRGPPRRPRLAPQGTGTPVRGRRGLLMASPPLTALHAAEAAPALDLLTVPQVMVRLQLGRSAVYDLLRSGQLASITLGRARRIPTHALTDFIRTRLDEKAA
ncbi:DNA binding domain-containing protein, excisionase family [Streptomyces sp. DpondAA-F4]|nr:DNA binding domain-containing protein, excisionase family [Streptomyces sp. DpondAA-F4]